MLKNVVMQSLYCFLISNFTLKFCLKNPAATRGVSPSFSFIVDVDHDAMYPSMYSFFPSKQYIHFSHLQYTFLLSFKSLQMKKGLQAQQLKLLQSKRVYNRNKSINSIRHDVAAR